MNDANRFSNFVFNIINMIGPSYFIINDYTKEICVFSICNIHTTNGYISRFMFYPCVMKHHVLCLFYCLLSVCWL